MKLNVSKTECILSGRRKKISCLRKNISYKYQYFDKNTAEFYVGHNDKELNKKKLVLQIKRVLKKNPKFVTNTKIDYLWEISSNQVFLKLSLNFYI